MVKAYLNHFLQYTTTKWIQFPIYISYTCNKILYLFLTRNMNEVREKKFYCRDLWDNLFQRCTKMVKLGKKDWDIV